MPPANRDKPAPAPVSTYRLQLSTGFGFAQAAEQADYLTALGVTHVYLSPILQANPGSTHGYDVVDHSRISADLGGEDAFRAMVRHFHGHSLGVVVDVVPNHMALPVPAWLNRQLWSVLYQGKASEFAHWFDVDWDAQDNKLVMPILAGPLEECLNDLAIDILPGYPGPVLRYFGHELPLRDGTADLPLGELLAVQHYRLASWRAAATQLNWRRFLDISTLIGIRVEDPDVFAATHEVLLRLYQEELIDGLRVDHPDSLADPAGYLARLAAATGGAWVVAEKILARGEELPNWQCAGTTGYDTLSAVDGLFVEPGAGALLASTYVRRTGGVGTFAEVAEAAKRETASLTFAAELSRLCRLLAGAGVRELAAFGAEDLRTVLIEILVAFPVYRAYIVPGEPPPQVSAAVMARVAASVRHRLPLRLHPALRAVCLLLLGLDSDQERSRIRDELIVRFQQTSGPVMAKGIEDTAFFRWSRLAALNEVGGEPDRFGSSPAEFHALASRLARDWPATLTTLSTHDTKRQEDVRARLAVLAEWPQEWANEVADWHAAAAELSRRVAARLTPEPDIEYLMWQTLVGAWPVAGERLDTYLLKALREAKTRTLTSWTNPNIEYEHAVLSFASAVLRDPALTARIAAFVARIAPDARVHSLGAKLAQLTMPGVPDVYQGCELTGLSLVDPDNRRPVDFMLRRRLLATLDAGLTPLENPSSPSRSFSRSWFCEAGRVAGLTSFP